MDKKGFHVHENGAGTKNAKAIELVLSFYELLLKLIISKYEISGLEDAFALQTWVVLFEPFVVSYLPEFAIA